MSRSRIIVINNYLVELFVAEKRYNLLCIDVLFFLVKFHTNRKKNTTNIGNNTTCPDDYFMLKTVG